jgi:hypothetical protein
MNDGQIWAVGYCAEHEGHATKEEAQECYRKYLLERRTSFDLVLRDWIGCRVCGRPTKKGALVGPTDYYPLCKQHLNQQALETLVKVGEEVSSY